MKTTKQLKKAYIILVKKNYRAVNSHFYMQKVSLTDTEAMYFQTVNELVYDGSTTRDLMSRELKFKFNEDGSVTKAQLKKLGKTMDELQEIANVKTKEAGRLINSKFEKFRILLNDIYPWQSENISN